MTDLKRVLIGISEGADKAGGAVSRQAKIALRVHRKRNLAIAITQIVLILLCLSLSTYLLVTERSNVSRMVATLAGIGAGGAVARLRTVWRDYAQTDLLLILAEDATEAQIMALITKLIKRL